MPIIKVWRLPLSQTEDWPQILEKSIVAAVLRITELGLKGPEDITVTFPIELVKRGLGQDIFIEVSGLYDKPERTEEVRQRLAKSLGECVHAMHHTSKVECFVETFDPRKGFWSSATPVQQ